MTDSERRIAAAERLRRVLHWRETGVGNLRTHLDEWAAYQVGGGLLTGGGNQRWFNHPCAVKEGPRLLQYMNRFSPEAMSICLRGQSGDVAVKKPKSGSPAPFRLVVDHSIPIKVLGDEIRSNNALNSAESIREFLLAHFRRAVITKREDDLLNQPPAGEKRTLKQRMPTGWRFGDDHYARYSAAGIALADAH